MKTLQETKPKIKVQELESLADLLSEKALVKVIYDRSNSQNAPIDIGYCDIVRRRLVRILVPRPDNNTILWQYMSKKKDITLEEGCLCFNGGKTLIINTHYKSIGYQELYNKLKNAGLSN